MTSTPSNPEQPTSACCNAMAFPPSPLMLANGNDYYTCQKCGEKCGLTPAPTEGVEPVSEVDKILDIKWGLNKIYGIGEHPKGSHSYWSLPDDVKAELKAAIERLIAEARIKEGGLWLQMVVRNDAGKLDSNEWYKLNPRDVARFQAERLDELNQMKGQTDGS